MHAQKPGDIAPQSHAHKLYRSHLDGRFGGVHFSGFARFPAHPFSAPRERILACPPNIPMFMIDWHVRNHLLIRWPRNACFRRTKRSVCVHFAWPCVYSLPAVVARARARPFQTAPRPLGMKLAMAFHLLFENANEAAPASRQLIGRISVCSSDRSDQLRNSHFE